MGNSRLGNAQLFLDASNTDSVLEAVPFGDMKTLRRKIGRGVFQPGEDLEPYGIGKGFDSWFYDIYNFRFINTFLTQESGRAFDPFSFLKKQFP